MRRASLHVGRSGSSIVVAGYSTGSSPSTLITKVFNSEVATKPRFELRPRLIHACASLPGFARGNHRRSKTPPKRDPTTDITRTVRTTGN